MSRGVRRILCDGERRLARRFFEATDGERRFAALQVFPGQKPRWVSTRSPMRASTVERVMKQVAM